MGHWDALSGQDWGLPWHRNEGIELTLVEHGRIGFAVDEQTYLLESGSLTLTRPWQRHRVGDPNIGAGRLHWLIIDVGVRRPHQAWQWPPWLLFSPDDLKTLTKIIRYNEQPVWKASPELIHCFHAIARVVESENAVAGASRLAVRLNDLFLSLLDLLQARNLRLDETLTSSERTVDLFLHDLRANPEHLGEPWSVGGMAESCGLGTTQFAYHVRRLTNTTPGKYLTQLRLMEASRLLQERTAGSILDIALKVGFSSSQYFATAFHQHFGCSPREFRLRLLAAPATA